MKSRPILSLFVLYLSVVCARGDLYDVNVTPGYTLFANQLALSPNDLADTALGQMLPNQSQILTWNGQSFFLITKLLGNWNSDLTINVGQAFYCRLPSTASPLSIPFTGVASTSPTPIPGFTPTTSVYLLGSQTYDPTPGATYNYYDITGYAPVAGVSLFRAKTAVPGGTAIGSTPYDSPLEWDQYEYDGTSWHFGSSTGPVTSQPQILLGEGVWIGPPEVPEPTTMIAGALLLLPFGASTLRLLRKTRTA